MNALRPSDIDSFARLRIDTALLAEAQVRFVNDREGRDLLGINGQAGDFNGIEFPYMDPHTGFRVTSRVRLDHPPLRPDGTPDGKYRSGYGDNRHLYFAPGAGPLLTDVKVPVVFVEAEKSSLALTAAAARHGLPLLVVATGGDWGWRGRIGKVIDPSGARVDEKGPLLDLSRITLSGRTAIIMFDANAATNPQVQGARRAFAKVLTARGASVRIADVPVENGINGPDDFVGRHGDDALFALLDGSVPYDFVRNAAGRILANDLDNIRLALAKLGMSVEYDAFAQQVLIAGRPADDLAVDGLWVRIVDSFSFRPSKETLRTVIVVDAQNGARHPVREYLDLLKWDGIQRLDNWLVTHGGAPLSPYVQAVGALPLIAAVRRVREPGVKFDELLVLESAQGTQKSTALRTLCPEEAWFSDDLPLGVDSKLVIERTAGKWIIEAAEMHGNRGKEAEQLKAFLSRQVDGPVRLAYGRLPTTVPRQFVMVGTTNSHLAYLKDATGARRFWPVKVERFDVAALEHDRDQLWAEAAEREAQGESIRLASHLWVTASEHQEQRRASDPWEDTLEHLLGNDEPRVAVSQIWAALGVEACWRDNRHADRVAAILQRHGFVARQRLRASEGASATWHWVRAPSDPSDTPSE